MDHPHTPRLHGDGISLMTPDPDWWYGRDTDATRSYHELFYVTTGRLEMAHAGEVQHIETMHWCLVPPGSDRRTFASGHADLAFFTVQWVDGSREDARLHCGDDPSGRLLTLLHWLLQEMRETAPEHRDGERAAVLLPTIIAALAAPPPSPDRGIARAVALMREQLERNLRLAELAGYAGMSRETFQRRFKAQTGCTPNRFLTQLRIERACTLLRETTLPLTDIAARCGWHDAPRMCRVFAQHLGRKPSDVRA